MTDSVSFKAYLKRGGQEVEVRRFGIDGGAAANYMYLRGKIQTVFPSVQNDQFTVFWQDNDNDYITISSDEELVVALTSSNVQPFKLYIHIKAPQQQSPGASAQQTHAGVTCDGCEGSVVGFRYKCVTCPDFDLCSSCEAAGHHPEHFMLRLPTPVSGSYLNSKFFRKAFRPHKFHKRHGWNRKADTHGWTFMEDLHAEPESDGLASHWRTCRQEATAPGMTDMFDLSPLFEFISSLAENNTGGSEEPSANAKATSSSQAHTHQATSSQESNPRTRQAHIRPDLPTHWVPDAKLNDIGKAITALLDPFGINVTFDVQSKHTDAATSSATSQQTTSGTTQQQTTSATTPQQTTSATTQQQNTTATSSQNGSTTPPKNTSTTESPSVVPQTEAIPLPAPQAAESSSATARRNSDDWTLINRESPTRSEVVAMDVDESRAARSKSTYPELPKEAPSAPPQPDTGLSDSERQRIQGAIDIIRSMGFNFEPTVLRELLRRENCDIASVLEMILSNAGKK